MNPFAKLLFDSDFNRPIVIITRRGRNYIKGVTYDADKLLHSIALILSVPHRTPLKHRKIKQTVRQKISQFNRWKLEQKLRKKGKINPALKSTAPTTKKLDLSRIKSIWVKFLSDGKLKILVIENSGYHNWYLVEYGQLHELAKPGWDNEDLVYDRANLCLYEYDHYADPFSPIICSRYPPEEKQDEPVNPPEIKRLPQPKHTRVDINDPAFQASFGY